MRFVLVEICFKSLRSRSDRKNIKSLYVLFRLRYQMFHFMRSNKIFWPDCCCDDTYTRKAWLAEMISPEMTAWLMHRTAVNR